VNVSLFDLDSDVGLFWSLMQEKREFDRVSKILARERGFQLNGSIDKIQKECKYAT